MKPILDAQHLFYDYTGHPAVSDFSLQLPQGKILGLLGQNGAGKSTVLKMLAGVSSPKRGEISINGHSLQNAPDSARSDIGYLPESPPLYDDMRVHEYLVFCAQIRGLKGVDIDNAVDESLQRCDLESLQRRLIGGLSKGERQRTGIAQALIHRPALLLLDEPTDGLDPLQLQSVRELILKLGREHAVILSSHLLSEVQAVCDEVLILHQGRCRHHGALADQSEQSPWRLKLLSPPSPAEIQTLPGVERIETAHSGDFLLHGDIDAQTLAAAVLKQDWGFDGLHRENTRLEQLFLNISQGRQTETAEAPA